MNMLKVGAMYINPERLDAATVSHDGKTIELHFSHETHVITDSADVEKLRAFLEQIDPETELAICVCGAPVEMSENDYAVCYNPDCRVYGPNNDPDGKKWNALRGVRNNG